jgi:4-carboxymuconolactone decarboxylase
MTDNDAAIDARQALIAGQPQRLTPLDKLSEEALEVTGRLRQLGSRRPPPTSAAEVPDVVATMLRHPQLYGRMIDMSIQLGLNGTLSPRQQELVILRVGWLCQAPFEFGEHVAKGKRFGLTSDEIERIVEGPEAEGWDELDRAMLRAVDELHGDAMISDATWTILARHLDDRQLIELPILAGQFVLVAYSQNSLRLRLNDSNLGLRAR